MTDPFVVATGQLTTAQNIFIRITLSSGMLGYGEIAPFPDLTSEDRPVSLSVARRLATAVLGKSVLDYRELGRLLQEMAPDNPAARCGLETAFVDSLCQTNKMPLWRLWGEADVRDRETDITIPIIDLPHTLTFAREWHKQGFQVFKMKVGNDGDEDIRRLEAIHQQMPDVAFIIDANQGFQMNEAAEFTKRVLRFGGQIILLEQPVPKDDLEALAYLRQTLSVPIAADESVRSLKDARAIVRHKAADFINIKIMKSSLIESLDIAAFAKLSGVRLMIGGMVETRIAMGCSFSLALGLGGFEVLDLDTPLLMSQDPVNGGYRYTGPQLAPWTGYGLGSNVEISGKNEVIN